MRCAVLLMVTTREITVALMPTWWSKPVEVNAAKTITMSAATR